MRKVILGRGLRDARSEANEFPNGKSIGDGFNMKNVQLRVARPTDNLDHVADMVREGLGFEALATFEDHDGFDGVILGVPGA